MHSSISFLISNGARLAVALLRSCDHHHTGEKSTEIDQVHRAIQHDGLGSPCGACKFLRRKCARGCVFAPYFCHEQGTAHFAAIHKVFGARNVSKLLAHLPVANRTKAAVTVSYEAQARIWDPVYGCVAHIFALQQQVMTLQAQLASLRAHALLKANATPELQQEDAKGYMGGAAEQYGYSGKPWCNGNGVSMPAAQQLCADGRNGGAAGHDCMSALLAGSAASDYMVYHALEQSAPDDDGQAAAFEGADQSSSFRAAEESGWIRSLSGYQDCEDLQSVAYAYVNRP